MTQLQLQLDLSHWIINVAFWTCMAFPVATRTYWPWWDSWWGRNIVLLEMAIGLAILPSILRIDLGLSVATSPLFGWIALTSFTLIPLIIIHRMWLIWKVQRRAIDVEDDEDREDRADPLGI